MENQDQRMGDAFRQNRRNNSNNENENSSNSRRGSRNNHSNNHHDNMGGVGAGGGDGGRRDRDRDYYGERGNSSRGGGGGGGGTGIGRNNRRSSYNSNRGNNNYNNNNNSNKNMTLEYGKIHSLLDKFGFIYCADRPLDIFFHYSESNQPIHSLEIGQEVQFYVAPAHDMRRGGGGGGGSSSSEIGGEKKEKLSAYSITTVEAGTVVWETEDEPGKRYQGLVERVIRPSGVGGGRGRDRGTPEGTVRIQLEEEEEKDDDIDGDDNDINNSNDNDNDAVIENQTDDNGNGNDNDETKKLTEGDEQTTKPKQKPKGPIVRYTSDDYPGYYDTPLARNDRIEFTVVTQKRSGIKYARDISMIQTERERVEEERERKLLENATYERGVVTTLKNGFGFLRSTVRHEEVYFNYSHICLPDVSDTGREEGGGGGEGGTDEAKEEEEELTLKEGQDMEFYVVADEDSNGRKKISARQVSFLEKGSVLFRQYLVKGATGTVSTCPVLPDTGSSSFGRKSYRQNPSKSVKVAAAKDGKIQLDIPFGFHPAEHYHTNLSIITIEEVVLEPNNCPIIERDGREGHQVALWIREGDKLLFDIVRDTVDGKCRAIPTKCLEETIREIHLVHRKDKEPTATEDVTEKVTTEDEEEEKVPTEDKKEEAVTTETNDEAVIEGDTNDKVSTNDEKTSEEKEEKAVTPITPKIRLVSLSSEKRVEGTIVSIKDNFGFIRPTDHNADIYFRLDEVLPTDMMEDLLRNKSITLEQGSNGGKPLSLSNGAKVMFDLITPPKNGGRSRGRDSTRIERIIIIEKKKPVKKKSGSDSNCQGYVLMEPSHTSLSNTPSHGGFSNSNAVVKEGGRWGNCVKERNSKSDFINNATDEGSILLISDPQNVFSRTKISYANSTTRSNPDKGPKRGDLICFLKAKGGDKARDVRILKRNAAKTLKGKLSHLDTSEGTATFNSEDGRSIPISLSDVISCNTKVLKENDTMEGIVHEEELVGICRTADLYLNSSIGSGLKERPRLNLTVKKELKGLGGKIIAQSGMAKGPDGTIGFHLGWTTRVSKFTPLEEEEEEETKEDEEESELVEEKVEDGERIEKEEVNEKSDDGDHDHDDTNLKVEEVVEVVEEVDEDKKKNTL